MTFLSRTTYNTIIRSKTGAAKPAFVKISHNNHVYVYTAQGEIWGFTPELKPAFIQNAERLETQFRFEDDKIFADKMSSTQSKATTEIDINNEQLQSFKQALAAIEAISDVKPLPDAVQSKIPDAYKYLGIEPQKGLG